MDEQPEQPLLLTAEARTNPPSAESRADFEKGMSYWPRLTIALILINTVVFIAQLIGGALESKESIIAAGALERSAVLEGEVWRLLSAVFLHGGFDHLLGNCFALYVLGMAVEHAFGVSRSFVIYLLCGIFASIISIVAAPGPSVGASGAIFGLMSLTAVFFYRYRKLVFLKDNRLGLVLLVWAGFQFFTGAMSPMVDNFAHLGGFAAGAVVGLFARPVSLERFQSANRQTLLAPTGNG